MNLPENLSADQKVRLLKLLEARKSAENDQRLKHMEFNLVADAFLCSTAKIRVLCGANQSGKSTTGGADLLIRSGQEMPDSIKDHYPTQLIKPGEYWAAAVDFPSSHDVQEKKVFELLPKRNLKKWNKEFRELYTENDSVIGFKSAESGREKFQGAVKRGFWGDEELQEPVWDEAYMRVIALAGWMTLTFSPLKGLTYAYSKLWKKAARYFFSENIHNIKEEVGLVHSLDEIKLMRQRRLVTLANTNADVDPNIECFQMSAYDNLYLSDVEIQNAERKYKDDPAQYNARILGRFTKLTGNNVFNIHQLIKMQSKCPSTFKRGEIVDGKFKPSTNGSLIIFKDKKLTHEGFYVVGADCSEGLPDGDFGCIQVLDHLTCEQVAVWHGKVPIEDFGRVLYNIGRYFNNAYLAPERNFNGVVVVNKLRELKYPRIYCSYEPVNEVIRTEHSTAQKQLGWLTSPKSKPLAIGNLAEFISSGQIKLNDLATIEECTTYINKGDQKTGALGGCHDDRVMALAIALQVFRTRKPQFKTEKETKPSDVDKYTGY